MQYWQCKCGKSQWWTSGETPPACLPCDECGSVPATHPDYHREPVAHKFDAISEVETDEGMKKISRCIYCHYSRGELERRSSNEQVKEK